MKVVQALRNNIMISAFFSTWNICTENDFSIACLGKLRKLLTAGCELGESTISVCWSPTGGTPVRSSNRNEEWTVCYSDNQYVYFPTRLSFSLSRSGFEIVFLSGRYFFGMTLECCQIIGESCFNKQAEDRVDTLWIIAQETLWIEGLPIFYQ